MFPPELRAECFPYPVEASRWSRLRTWIGWVSGIQGRVDPVTSGEVLAEQLEKILRPRIVGASRPDGELRRAVEELRCLGHALQLDEDDPEARWTIYADRPQRNLAIWVTWSEEHPHGVRAQNVEVLWQRM